jgi:hypothetical protein
MRHTRRRSCKVVDVRKEVGTPGATRLLRLFPGVTDLTLARAPLLDAAGYAALGCIGGQLLKLRLREARVIANEPLLALAKVRRFSRLSAAAQRSCHGHTSNRRQCSSRVCEGEEKRPNGKEASKRPHACPCALCGVVRAGVRSTVCVRFQLRVFSTCVCARSTAAADKVLT